MRSSRVSTEGPSLCTVDARSGSRVGLAAFPAPALPGFDPPDWSSGLQRYYSAIRLPESHLPFSLLRLVGHTRFLHDWSVTESNKNLWVSLVALMTSMCSANGPSTPGLLSQLARTRREMLPSSVHRPWAESNRIQNFGAQYHSAPRGHSRSIHPHYLSVYASTPLRRRRQHDGFTLLIPTLQHSIRSLWLRATPAGFPPARHQTISSPHVHRFVSRCLQHLALNRKETQARLSSSSAYC